MGMDGHVCGGLKGLPTAEKRVTEQIARLPAEVACHSLTSCLGHEIRPRQEHNTVSWTYLAPHPALA